MFLHAALSLSPPNRLSPSIKSIYALSLLFLTIKGVQYPAVTLAAVVSLGNSPSPIPAEMYATPAEENLRRICVVLCTAGLGGLPCAPYHCSEFFSSNVKNADVGDGESAEYDHKGNLITGDPKYGDLKRDFKDPSDQLRYNNHPCDSHHHHGHNPPTTTTASSRSTWATVPSIAMPRRMVCGKLCEYNLGKPLCECVLHQQYSPMDVELVCRMFCTSYGYQLDGCPVCTDVSGLVEDGSYGQQKHKHWAHGTAGTLTTSALAPETARKQIDWNEWCKERCAEGDGGAACNCDILPLIFDT